MFDKLFNRKPVRDKNFKTVEEKTENTVKYTFEVELASSPHDSTGPDVWRCYTIIHRVSPTGVKVRESYRVFLSRTRSGAEKKALRWATERIAVLEHMLEPVHRMTVRTDDV